MNTNAVGTLEDFLSAQTWIFSPALLAAGLLCERKHSWGQWKFLEIGKATLSIA